MAGALDTWQTRMERHFETLSARRSESGLPIFALEHGLSETDREEIAELLQQRLRAGAWLAPHWLLWTIYAAERGYSYEGDEYWQSFEEVTPGWEGRDRYRVSAWFTRFRKSYNGVRPSGAWASHFSIIAWPITHAVLPRYLQRQFAYTLYRLRFHLARLNSIEPGVIGRMIAANAYDTSTRFQQFLQQEELVGRIVLALLHRDPHGADETLLPETLERIVTDLETIGNARTWLNDTTRVVEDRFKGLGRGTDPRGSAFSSVSGGPAFKEPRPNVRPDLRLHYKGDGGWDLQIDIPSFKAIAALNPDIREFLKQTRCTLNGSHERRPAGWLLSSRRQAVLKEWPDPEMPLIGFEKQNSTIAHILENECRVSAGPTWLFRVGRDGIAREIVGRIVRPGFEYIIATREPLPEMIEGMRPCTINCPEIEAVHLHVPQEVSESYVRWLKSQNLEIARTIRVWPAGLPGRHWDGEGRSEWLTTEKPCFGIMPDHTVETYEVTLNGSESTIIRAGLPGEPNFFQLPELDAGQHVLTVRARRNALSSDADTSPAHEGYLELRVREPEPWTPGTTAHSGLIVSSNPPDATLDGLWESELDLTIRGPAGRQVIPSVVLENPGGEEFFRRQISDSVDLPVTSDGWRRRFRTFVQREGCEWRYLEAASGFIEIDGAELGRAVLRFEHEVRPVRWVLCHEGSNISVRLVDDTDQEGVEPKCRFFDMEMPRQAVRLEPEEAFSGAEVPSPGGLYIAQVGEYWDAVVISNGLSGDGLQGLGVEPKHGHMASDPKAIAKLLRVLRYWSSARVAGYLAGQRRSKVTDVLLKVLYGVIAGWKWAHAESGILVSRDPAVILNRLQTLVEHRSGFSSVLRRDAPAIEGRKALIRWYSELAGRYGVCADDKLCGFAVDIASRPQILHRRYRDELPAFIAQLQNKPVVLRGARLAMLSRICANDRAALLPEARV